MATTRAFDAFGYDATRLRRTAIGDLTAVEFHVLGTLANLRDQGKLPVRFGKLRTTCATHYYALVECLARGVLELAPDESDDGGFRWLRRGPAFARVLPLSLEWVRDTWLKMEYGDATRRQVLGQFWGQLGRIPAHPRAHRNARSDWWPGGCAMWLTLAELAHAGYVTTSEEDGLFGPRLLVAVTPAVARIEEEYRTLGKEVEHLAGWASSDPRRAEEYVARAGPLALIYPGVFAEPLSALAAHRTRDPRPTLDGDRFDAVEAVEILVDGTFEGISDALSAISAAVSDSVAGGDGGGGDGGGS